LNTPTKEGKNTNKIQLYLYFFCILFVKYRTLDLNNVDSFILFNTKFGLESNLLEIILVRHYSPLVSWSGGKPKRVALFGNTFTFENQIGQCEKQCLFKSRKIIECNEHLCV
jgi:hypothetical protein